MAFIQPSDVSAGEATKASNQNAQNDSLADLDSRVTGFAGLVLANGSFEIDDGASVPEPSNWDITDLSGGSHALISSPVVHGKQALGIVTTATSGRAEVLSADFLPVAQGDVVEVIGYWDTDVVGIKGTVQILFYNTSESLIDTDTLVEDASVSTSYEQFRGWSDGAPAATAFFKVKLIGGDSASSTTAGNIRFDGISARVSPFFRGQITPFTSNGSYIVPAGIDKLYAVCVSAGAGGGGGQSVIDNAAGGGGGGGGGVVEGWLDVTAGETLTIEIGAGGGGGAEAVAGTDGGITAIADASANILIRSIGGAAGGAGSGSGTTPGAGGSGGSSSSTTELFLLKSLSGNVGTQSTTTAAGGAGGLATSYRGTAGVGAVDTAGTNGTGIGAGGGGGGAAESPGNGRAGGDGSDGKIFIYF